MSAQTYTLYELTGVANPPRRLIASGVDLPTAIKLENQVVRSQADGLGISVEKLKSLRRDTESAEGVIVCYQD